MFYSNNNNNTVVVITKGIINSVVLSQLLNVYRVNSNNVMTTVKYKKQ